MTPTSKACGGCWRSSQRIGASAQREFRLWGAKDTTVLFWRGLWLESRFTSLSFRKDLGPQEGSAQVQKKCSLEPSSALNEVYDQHDDGNYEQDVDQAAANMADEAKKPEHDQDDNYSPEHEDSFRLS